MARITLKAVPGMVAGLRATKGEAVRHSQILLIGRRHRCSGGADLTPVRETGTRAGEPIVVMVRATAGPEADRAVPKALRPGMTISRATTAADTVSADSATAGTRPRASAEVIHRGVVPAVEDSGLPRPATSVEAEGTSAAVVGISVVEEAILAEDIQVAAVTDTTTRDLRAMESILSPTFHNRQRAPSNFSRPIHRDK